MERIDIIRETEANNYARSREVLGEGGSLVQDLVKLGEFLEQLIRESDMEVGEDTLFGVHFVHMCRYQLIIANLALLRGHIADSVMATRRAIEHCAFAAAIKREPALLSIWISSGKDDASYRQYRNSFGSKTIFPKGNAPMAALYERYDFFSRFVHSSLTSIALRTSVKNNVPEFSYFELKNDDATEPARTFLMTVDIHLMILEVFEEIFADAIAHDRTKWEVAKNAFVLKQSAERDKWMPILLPGTSSG